MFEDCYVEEVVANLATTDMTETDDRDLVDLVRSAAAVVAWAECFGLVAVAELRRRRQAEHAEITGGRPSPTSAASGDEVDRFTAVEVAAALRVSQQSAVARVALADDLTQRLPRTVAAFAAGQIGLGHARAVVEAVTVTEDDLARTVEAHVLQRPHRTPGQLARACRRAVDAADPGASERRCAAARERRRAQSWGLEDGMAALQVVGPATAVAGAWARVDDLARQAQYEAVRRSRDAFGRLVASDDTTRALDVSGDVDLPDGVPTLDQARADVVLQLLCGSADLAVEPSPSVSVGVDVLVPLSTLAGLCGDPAELAGYGPLPTSVARAVAAAAARVRVVSLADDGTVEAACGAGCDVGTALATDGDIGTTPAGSGDTGTTPAAGSSAGGAAPGTSDVADRPPAGPTRGSHGPTPYRPTASMVARIRARDVTCRFVGCSRRARACDVDHTVPHPDGPTAPCNLACLCRMHHRVKHRAGWDVVQLGRGRLRWTSPTGHVYDADPPRWRCTDPSNAAPDG